MNDELVKFDNLISYTAPNVVIKKLKNREIVFEFLCQKLTEKWSTIFNDAACYFKTKGNEFKISKRFWGLSEITTFHTKSNFCFLKVSNPNKKDYTTNILFWGHKNSRSSVFFSKIHFLSKCWWYQKTWDLEETLQRIFLLYDPENA